MNKSKFNWGTGILIAIIIFMAITVSTVIYLMNQKVDLVTDNYYAKEIKYQQQIDMMNRTNEMGEAVKINSEEGFVKIIFPKSLIEKKLTGTVQFYRPSDSGKDFTLPLVLDSSSQQLVPSKILQKGYWKVIVNWNQDSLDYVKESSFVIN